MKKSFIIFLILFLFIATSCDENELGSNLGDRSQYRTINSDGSKEETTSSVQVEEKKTDKFENIRDSSNKENTKEEQKSTQNSIKEDISKKDISESTTVATSSKQEVVQAPIKADNFDKYKAELRDILKTKLEYDDTYEIVLEDYYDFNYDGNIEAIVVLKKDDEFLKALYLSLYQKEPLLDYIDLFSNVVKDVKLIQVNGVDDKVFYYETEPISGFNGVHIFKLSLGVFDPYVDTESFSGRTTTELIDKNNDGIYDEYITRRNGYDVFFYPLEETFFFDGNTPRFKEGHITLIGYPKTPEEVVLQYMSLSQLKFVEQSSFEQYNINGLDDRINQLCETGYDEKYVWSFELLKNTHVGIDPMISFKKSVEGDRLIVNTNIETQYDKKFVGTFKEGCFMKYELEERDGKWVIVSQEEVESQQKTVSKDKYKGKFESHFFDDKEITIPYELEISDFDANISELNLVNEVIFHGDTEFVTHVYSLEKIPNVPDGRQVDWYFVEKEGLVYKMDYDVFSEYMRTGENQERMVLVASVSPVSDILSESEKGFHNYVEMDDKGYIIGHSWNNSVESGFYETFVWKKDNGLIEYKSGYGADKETIKLTIGMY